MKPVEHSSASRPAPRWRVLLVDDHAQLRQLLRTALSVHGFEVVEASTSTAALEHVQTPPAAIVLDLQHAADGYELLRRLRNRAHLRRVPILLVCGDATDEFRRRALSAGADFFSRRPLSMLQLQRAVRELVQSGRSPTPILAAPSSLRAS